jgi:hypothetical protein
MAGVCHGSSAASGQAPNRTGDGAATSTALVCDFDGADRRSILQDALAGRNVSPYGYVRRQHEMLNASASRPRWTRS